MIDVRGLTRVFGARKAVDALSMSIEGGQLCALLGPNGAGKTTTVRMLMGLVKPTVGQATVAGISIRDSAQLPTLRARVGLLTETPGFYDRLSALENLTLFGQMYGLNRQRLLAQVEEPLTTLELWDRRHEMVATYSKGMKQKLAVVRAIFHDPQVIFFDEPTAGLDPESARVVRQMIVSLKQAGRTMLVCTHNLSEASQLADVVAILRGRLLAFGPPHSLGRSSGPTIVRVTIDGGAEMPRSVVGAIGGVSNVAIDHDVLHFETDDPRITNPLVLDALVRAGVRVVELRVLERTLEDLYLEAVGDHA